MNLKNLKEIITDFTKEKKSCNCHRKKKKNCSFINPSKLCIIHKEAFIFRTELKAQSTFLFKCIVHVSFIQQIYEVVEFGYAFFANRKLITVFSAARYHEDLCNFAAVVVIDSHLELSFLQLKPSEYEQ
ncbi:hypothetical protein QQG55_55970 [Brugia pahangi]